MSLSLEDLINIEVTSASRMPQKLSKAAAAIYVITDQDIARAGVTSIPEALRLVPGMQVARIDSNKWAITCRGFNEAFANKMLVMIDGRTVYTPMFAGVFWDVQDVMLEDVERIEVIRGPGGTLWGANAVNGIINVITKSARKTQGLLAATGGGSEERGFARVRYGGSFGEDGFYRFYLKGFERDSGADLGGEEAADDWRSIRGGFNLEKGDEQEGLFTLQGDIYQGESGSVRPISSLIAPYQSNVAGDTEVSGQNLLLRWQKSYSETANSKLQLYYDGTDRREIALNEKRDTFDVDFQNQFVMAEVHNLVWGLGYRYTRDDFDSSFTVTGEPESRSDQLFSAFIQDNITLSEDRLTFIIGSKLEHNDYTGVEIQPSARLVLTPTISSSAWLAVSRAVRTPSRLDHDSELNYWVVPGTTYVSVRGDDEVESEQLTAYEAGLRYSPNDRINIDLTLFYNDYDSLITNEWQALPSFSGAYLVYTRTKASKAYGETYGAELAVDYQPLEYWQLKASYSLLQIDLHTDATSTDTSAESEEGKSPHHQASLLSTWRLSDRVELNAWWRYVDSLPELDIPGYHNLDLRVSWALTDTLKLDVVGQNLLDDERHEFTSATAISTAAERGIYVQLTGHFD